MRCFSAAVQSPSASIVDSSGFQNFDRRSPQIPSIAKCPDRHSSDLQVLVTLLLVKGLKIILQIGIMPMLAIGLMAISSLMKGHILGGPELINRATLAIATPTRNAG